MKDRRLINLLWLRTVPLKWIMLMRGLDKLVGNRKEPGWLRQIMLSTELVKTWEYRLHQHGRSDSWSKTCLQMPLSRQLDQLSKTKLIIPGLLKRERRPRIYSDKTLAGDWNRVFQIHLWLMSSASFQLTTSRFIQPKIKMHKPKVTLIWSKGPRACHNLDKLANRLHFSIETSLWQRGLDTLQRNVTLQFKRLECWANQRRLLMIALG